MRIMSFIVKGSGFALPMYFGTYSVLLGGCDVRI